MMECPTCKVEELQITYTEEGIELDYCLRCGGVWLDKGEVDYFVTNPERVDKNLDNAIEGSTSNGRLSPRCGTAMVEIQYPSGPKIDYCPTTRGLWFDCGELKELMDLDKNSKP